MVNILRFPGSGKADTPAHTRVDDVQALLVEDSAMVFTSESAFPALKHQATPYPVSSGDWTNQELADLYRVEALLVQAGMRLESDRGVTDEDEPWFVFCSQDGDVFVHLARIDGRYLLDSPGLGAPLQGDDFNALVDMFVRHQAAIAPSGNVVRFRPGSGKDGVVRLHPAMMMAALIWTLYLASDHFVGTAEAAEAVGGDQLGPDHHLLGPETIPGPITHKPTYLDRGNQAGDDAPARGLGSEMRAGSQTGGLAGNAIAASLSAIAASWGLFDLHVAGLPELSELEDTATLRLDSDLDKALAASSSEHQPVNVPVNDHQGPMEQALVKPETLNELHLEQAAYAGTRASSLADAEGPLPNKMIASLESVPMPDRLVAYSLDIQKLTTGALVSSSFGGTGNDAAPADLQSLLKLAGLFAGETQKYTFGNISLSATFDIASLGKDAAGLVLSQLPTTGAAIGGESGNGASPIGANIPSGNIAKAPDIVYDISAYDEDAQDFVQTFLHESPHVEMIKVGNAIIFLDTTAIDDTTDVSATRSWSLDETTTVMTIGHADYFAQHFQDYYLA